VKTTNEKEHNTFVHIDDVNIPLRVNINVRPPRLSLYWFDLKYPKRSEG